MSVELDWSTVDYELTRSVHTALADAFAECALPDFVGPLSLDSFSFGDTQPDVQILDITDIDKTFLDAHDEPEPVPGDARFDHDPSEYGGGPPQDYSSLPSGAAYSRSRSRSHSPAPYPHPDAYRPLAPPAGPPSSAPSPSFQLLVRIRYAGNLSLSLSTSLRINYPSPAFMALPLQLALTDLAFEGVLVVAYEGGKNRVHVSLVDSPPSGPSDGNATPAVPPPTPIAPRGLSGGAGRTSAAAAAKAKERFLRSAHFESQVGNADKHVLRNVGKVEKFVLDVARTTLENELVFP